MAKLLQLTSMAPPLQKTKLYLPPARPRLVDRPRLLERLDGLRAEGSRVGLISAPAGSGKTTLAVQWLARLGWPTGWVSLDARDNTPARFFAYLIAAVQTIVQGAGSAALTLLDLPGANMEEVVTLLVNDLAEAPGPFVLALDDFHTITSPQLHQTLDLLIEAQPPQMRLLLLSREDPAMQLARRRARGQLVELRQDDLRFTLEEAVAFLNQGMGLNLTTAQVQMLEARTEGWIAGLQMAALALQSLLDAPSQDIDRFLQDFSGSHRFILDYLLEEVLARQPEDVQRFLLETSILERMCADLCAAVIGMTGPEAQKQLEQLARANLFVIPLDAERRWFRYHHLFRDLLLARLQSDAPERSTALERSASDWYEANGEPRTAVEYALKAGDLHNAADLIDRHISERWQTVDLEFHMLIQRLPFDVIAGRPSLCLQNAWLCVMFGQTDRMLPFIEAAEKTLEQPEYKTPAGSANRAFAQTLRAYLTDMDNQPVVLDESLNLAMAAIPEANVGMRNSVAVLIGSFCYMEGDFAAAVRFFDDAIALDKRVNGTNAVPIATVRMAKALQAQGRLHEAERRLREADSYCRERGIRRFYISGTIHLLWAAVLLEWNQQGEADALVAEGMRLLEDWPFPQARALGYCQLARQRIAQGDLAGARSAFKAADSLRQGGRFHPMFAIVVEQTHVRLLIAEQDRAGLEAWAREHQPVAEKTLTFRYEPWQVELCRVWLALGRVEEATSLLERLAGAASDRSGSRITIMSLLASLEGPTPRGLAVLDEALRLAEPESYLRTFVEAGGLIQQALSTWLRQGVSRDEPRLRKYAQKILACFSGTAPVTRSAVMEEPLSPREIEVLRLVSDGLTNQQIADRLVISVRTVKKHVENIHGKLGAENRTQAVARARELGILG